MDMTTLPVGKEPQVPIVQEAGMDVLEKRGISFLCQELNPDTLATQPIAQALY
jgi:hypothetical protein